MIQQLVLGALAIAATAGLSRAGIQLIDAGPGFPPSGTSSVFKAVGTFQNPAGGAARLEAAGQSTVQGGIGGGTGWWLPGVIDLTRSWEIAWNNTSGTVTFRLFSSTDWTGAEAMSMTQTPVFSPGLALVGFDFGVQLASTSFSTYGNFAYSDIQFNDGSGFLPITTANNAYSVQGSFFTSNYHLLVGNPGDFTLRGKSTFSGNVNTTADFARFYVDARQGVPAPLGIVPFCFGDGYGTPCPCANNAPAGSGSGCLNSNGTGGLLTASGTASLSGDTLLLSGSGMTNSFCVYIQGSLANGSGAGAVLGDGKLCVTNSLIRLGTELNVAGASTYPSATNPAPVSVRGAIASIGVKHYQVYYRNPTDFCTTATFNLTNGVSVTWVP
jgi:hypothetical protein